MSRTEATRFMEMLISDGDLRRDFRADPDAAVTKAGVQLDELDRAALSSVDWSGTSEELRARLNKDCAQYCGGYGGNDWEDYKS